MSVRQRLRTRVISDRIFNPEKICWRCAVQHPVRDYHADQSFERKQPVLSLVRRCQVLDKDSIRKMDRQRVFRKVQDAELPRPIRERYSEEIRNVLIKARQLVLEHGRGAANHAIRRLLTSVDETGSIHEIDYRLLRIIAGRNLARPHPARPSVRNVDTGLIDLIRPYRARSRPALGNPISRKAKPMELGVPLAEESIGGTKRVEGERTKEVLRGLRNAAQSPDVLESDNATEPEDCLEDIEFQEGLNKILNAFMDKQSQSCQAPSEPLDGIDTILPRHISNYSDRPRRFYSTTAYRHSRHESSTSSTAEIEHAGIIPPIRATSIKERLRVWQEHHNEVEVSRAQIPNYSSATKVGTTNVLANSGVDEGAEIVFPDDYCSEPGSPMLLDSAENVLDGKGNKPFFRQGDVVELWMVGEPVLAVFIRNFAKQSQFYTMQGKWVHRLSRQITFSLPGFFQPRHLDCILPYLPTEEIPDDKMDRLQLDLSVPRQIGRNIIERLQTFHEATNNEFRKNAERLDRAYEILAHPKERRFITLEDAARKLFDTKEAPHLKAATRWAVHRVLMQAEGIRTKILSHRLSPIFDIVPQEELDELLQVRRWLRKYQEGVIASAITVFDPDFDMKAPDIIHVVEFLEKARVLVKESRKTRAVTKAGFLGSSFVRIDPVGPQWTVWGEIPAQRFLSREWTIIRFLDAWANTRYLRENSSLASVGPMILRALGMYDGFELDQATAFVFLQEIGVLTPWENRTSYNFSVSLPGHGVDPETDRMQRLAAASAKDFVRTDSMKGLRKDWGDLAVFCIDSPDANEIDDGISLETIKDSQSEYWVHIHVANPTAFLGPDTDIMRYAAHIGESVYFPECRYSMMDPLITQKYFSLANDRPSITFSARITVNGEILETAVKNGTLRNVRHLTQSTLCQELALGDKFLSNNRRTITVGGDPPPSNITPTKIVEERLMASDVTTLRKLCELGTARRHKRERDGGISVAPQSFPISQPEVYFQKNRLPPSRLSHRGRLVQGDPIISLDVEEWNETSGSDLLSSANLVPDLMTLAGEIAATWCSQRNIPIAYRGTSRNPEPSRSPEEFKREIMDPAVTLYGSVPLIIHIRYITLIGRVSIASSAFRHQTLGAPAYCKITSPLRRYADVMAHWQIEAAIRHEAETGISLTKNPPPNGSYLPFSKARVDELIAHISNREKLIIFASRASERHWCVQLLFRAFYFKEFTLAETFSIYIYTETGWGKKRRIGIMKEYGFSVDIEDNATSLKMGGIDVGDWWEAKIEKVDPYLLIIDVTPVKLIQKVPELVKQGRK